MDDGESGFFDIIVACFIVWVIIILLASRTEAMGQKTECKDLTSFICDTLTGKEQPQPCFDCERECCTALSDETNVYCNVMCFKTCSMANKVFAGKCENEELTSQNKKGE